MKEDGMTIFEPAENSLDYTEETKLGVWVI
jgi:hypothetical protein